MTARGRGIVGAVLLSAWFAIGYLLMGIGVYGVTLYVLIPCVMGGITVWIFRQGGAGRAALVGAVGAGAPALLLLLLGKEGLVCLAMALPLLMPLGALGGLLVHAAGSARAARGIPMLFLLPPATLTFDTVAQPAVFETSTAVTIAASPAEVWKQLIAFRELIEPDEWFFRAGLAYPIRARIEGTGPGAIRYCEFSTGPFVEPIEVWDEPRLLRFRVTENPAPMHEWSPYGKIVPKHLHGYFISKRGQFRLKPLPNGHTLLEGTTWYQHGMWPAGYWRLWSDAIIHRIHLRVLNHVRAVTEESQRGKG